MKKDLLFPYVVKMQNLIVPPLLVFSVPLKCHKFFVKNGKDVAFRVVANGWMFKCVASIHCVVSSFMCYDIISPNNKLVKVVLR